jgi:hypothetical protein
MRGGGVGARVMESSMDTAPQRTGTAWSLLADAPGECGQHVTVRPLVCLYLGLCGFVYNCVCVVQCVPDILLNNYGAAPMPSRERRARQEHICRLYM